MELEGTVTGRLSVFAGCVAGLGAFCGSCVWFNPLSSDLMEGRIKFFNQAKGFGFIIGEDDKEYFYHISDFKERIETIEKETPVTFDLTDTDRGLKAINIELN